MMRSSLFASPPMSVISCIVNSELSPWLPHKLIRSIARASAPPQRSPASARTAARASTCGIASSKASFFSALKMSHPSPFAPLSQYPEASNSRWYTYVSPTYQGSEPHVVPLERYGSKHLFQWSTLGPLLSAVILASPRICSATASMPASAGASRSAALYSQVRPMILVGTRMVIVSRTKGSLLSSSPGAVTDTRPRVVDTAPVTPDPVGKSVMRRRGRGAEARGLRRVEGRGGGR
mmetsp:Transcript_24273/g.47099  ORF Transcript_24273/g.47099 Transcript_24273/m.47099 type:complete len:236 (+) Transcript_24273:671-1378(+)